MRGHRAPVRSALDRAQFAAFSRFVSLALSVAIGLGLAGAASAQTGVGCNTPLPVGSGVEKEIVVIVDGSGSISKDEWVLQRNALLQALDSPSVVARDGTIALAVVQASPRANPEGGDPILAQVEICLTQITSEAKVLELKNALSSIGQVGNGTSEGAGMLVGADLIFRTGDPVTEERRLCVLTDGVANSGPSAIAAAAGLAPDSIERISVAAVGQAQGGLDAPTAEFYFGPVVRGGGQLTHATSHPEFLALFPENCLADPVGLRAFEVNQSVQDWQGSVPLVEDKPTIARVFLEPLACATDPGALATSSGRLTASRDGSPLPGAILPFNQGARAYLDCAADNQREFDFRNLNFRLPPEWLSGDVTLSLEMPGGIDCGTGAIGAECDAAVSFEPLDFPDVDLLAVPSRILYDPRNPTQARPIREPTIDDLLEQEARLKAMLPVADILADLEFFETGLPAEGAQWTLDNSTGRWVRDRVDGYVLENVKWYFWKTRCTLAGGCPTDRLHAVTMGADGVVGVSNPDGIRASLSALASPSGTENVPLGTGHHRNSAAHELVHNFGVQHTANQNLFGTDADNRPLGPCGSVSAIGRDPLFQYTAYFSALDTATDNGIRALIGPLLLPPATRLPDEEIWGVATNIADWRSHQRLAIADPATDWALMSYCDLDPGLRSQDWVSITNYQGIVDLLRTTDFDAPLPVGITDVNVQWVIRGNIDEQLNDIGLLPYYQVPAPGPIDLEPGPYTVELLDASDTVLESASFATTLSEPDEPEDPSTTAELDRVPGFFVTLPDPATPVAEVVIRRGGTELSRVAASAAAPVVTITEPLPGASLVGETVRFAWEATDADGDDLHHAVDYSRDGGTTWVPLAVDLREPSLEVGRKWLRAGAGAVFRVTTTDGFRSTTVVSAPFGVANNPPTVLIRSPTDGQRYGSAQRVDLDAAAFDREDGRLDGDAVEWLSSRDGSLGFGARLEVGAETLAEGEHLLAARALDGDGAPGAAVARIFVSRVPESVRPEPDFSLRMDPPAQPINPGEEAFYIVYLTSLNGFDEAVTLEVLDLPPGWSADLDPAVVTPDGQSVLVVEAPADATETAFPIIVQGTSGDLVHTTSGTADLVFGLIPQCFGRIAGVVSDAYTGQPLEGARVQVASRNSETDLAGYYLSPEIGPRTDWRVEFSAPGYYTQYGPNTVVRCDDVKTVDQQLIPIRTGEIMGRVVVGVVDETGAVTPTDTPIEEASVTGAAGAVLTDSTGHYARTDVPLGGGNVARSHRFTATKEGFWASDFLATVRMDVPATLDFALVEQCLVTLTGSGQAVDEFGQPVAGVPVGWSNVNFPASEPVVSGLDGRFELPEVTSFLERNNAPRIIGLNASPPASDPFALVSSQTQFTVEECGEARLDGFEVVVTSRFVPPEENFARLQGTFRDDVTGEPLANVRYYVLKAQGGFLTTQLRGGADGTYDIEIQVGVDDDTSEEVFFATNPIETHWGTETEPFVAEADQTYVRDILMPAVDFATIEGYVRDRETGAPVGDARVDVQGGRSVDPVFTDASGFYTTQAYPGDLNTPTFLFVSAFRQPSRATGLPWYYFSQIQRFVEPGERVVQDFDLLRECDGGAISGVVVNAETLEPLEDATVEIAASPWRDETDLDGRFRLEGIWPRDGNQPRQVEVRASKSGFVTARRTVTVFCGAEIFLEFGAPSGGFGSIFGTVTDASTGDPLEGVFVGSGYGAGDTTDELGQYSLDNAPLASDGGPRVWTVTATHGLDQQSADVQVKAEAPTQQDFAFATQPALGLAVDDEHTAFDPATRTLTSRSTLTVTNTTDETIPGPVAATILVDRAGVSMPDADGSDVGDHPVFIVVEDGSQIAAGASVSVELVFVRAAPLAFLYDVQLIQGDPRLEDPGPLAAHTPLAVWPAESDADGDRWHDELDLCPTRPDPEQRDEDGDGVGDACHDLASAGAAGDRRPPEARADWIRLAGTAPAGAVRVELGAVSAEVGPAGRFEIESPVAATEATLELVFVDAEGRRDPRPVAVQAAVAATGESR